MLAELSALSVGQRVAAVWDEAQEQSILCIAGFAPALDAPVGTVKPFGETAAPLESIRYRMKLDYEHAYGPYYGRMFDEIREHGRIMGVRTSNGDDALLPPREIDDLTHKRTGTWKTCENTGTIRACSIINMEFIGQTRPPPYAYAEIVLDGASTRLIHMIEIESIPWAKEHVRPGRRVRHPDRTTRPAPRPADRQAMSPSSRRCGCPPPPGLRNRSTRHPAHPSPPTAVDR